MGGINEEDNVRTLSMSSRLSGDDPFDDDSEIEEEEEGVDEVEEEDEIEEEKHKRKPRRKSAARRVREPANIIRNAERSVKERSDQELEQFYESLNFGEDAVSVSIERLEPKLDPDTGNNISGHLHTFNEVVTVEDIKAKYGGGSYRVQIRGPNQSTGRGSVIRGSKTVKVAGNPKPQPGSSSSSAKAEFETMKMMIEQKDRDAQRAAAEAKESRDALFAIMAKSGESMNPVLTTMMENQKIEESRRREEKQREELRGREEREREDRERKEERREFERREEKREAERKEEIRRQDEVRRQEREDARRQHELQLEQTRLNSLAAQKQQEMQMQMMMQLMVGKGSTEKENQMMMLKLMSDNSAQAVASAQNMMSFQGNMFQTALQDAKESNKSKSQFGETLENFAQLKQVMNMIGGGEEDSRTGFEKAVDKLVEVVPTLGATAASVMASRSQPQRNQEVIQTSATVNSDHHNRGPMQPGVVAVVDDDEDDDVYKIPERSESKSNKESVDNQESQNRKQAENQQSTDQDSQPNDLKEVTIPSPATDIQTQFGFLIKNLDFGISQEWSSQKLYDEVVEKFPKLITNILLQQSEDDLINFLDENVPSSWVILTPRGEESVRGAHRILLEGR